VEPTPIDLLGQRLSRQLESGALFVVIEQNVGNTEACTAEERMRFSVAFANHVATKSQRLTLPKCELVMFEEAVDSAFSAAGIKLAKSADEGTVTLTIKADLAWLCGEYSASGLAFNSFQFCTGREVKGTLALEDSHGTFFTDTFSGTLPRSDTVEMGSGGGGGSRGGLFPLQYAAFDPPGSFLKRLLVLIQRVWGQEPLRALAKLSPMGPPFCAKQLATSASAVLDAASEQRPLPAN
jgi:hypothetical protein